MAEQASQPPPTEGGPETVESVKAQHLEQLRALRMTLEDERGQATGEMQKLKSRISQLEAENKKLKSSGGSGGAPAPAPAPRPVAAAAAAAAPSEPQPLAPEGFLQRLSVQSILQADTSLIGQQVTLCGWARTARFQGHDKFVFIEVNDGSSFGNVQVIASEENTEGWPVILEHAHTGVCFRFQGEIVASPAKGQNIECKASSVSLLGSCPPATYPLAKGRHPLEHLRSIAHIRPRSNTIGAMMRVRNTLAAAVHEFFQQRKFYYVHAPLLTSSDCEGAGEMFSVSTLLKDDPKALPLKPDGKVDFSKDFFSAPSFLTVSGQLEAEAYACAMSKVYTFGPTFRAENSHTPRHLAEFWMIEPEIAFADLSDDMDLAEGFLKYTCRAVLERCPDELAFFEKLYYKGLSERLRVVVDTPFRRMTYTDAQEALAAVKDRKWEFQPGWGEDLASEHERYLTEELVKGPVFVTDWPKDIKSFYMRLNDDGKTVAAMDCLLPKVGEIIGGSQREERLDVLLARMAEMNVSPEHLEWYLDLRRYGSCPHAGFGLGFERLVLFCTGLDNIRDVIPFPRYPGHCSNSRHGEPPAAAAAPPAAKQ